MTADPFVILYVEDSAYIRQSFAELLDAVGRRIVDVAGAGAARAVLLGETVNLLITDINLPDGSGLEVAREALRRNPALPVIICSGDDLRGVAESLGPTAHAMRKPVDIDEFVGLVERLAQPA